MVKLDGAADFPATVEAVTRAGIPVFAQFGLSPQTALRHGVAYQTSQAAGGEVPAQLTEVMVAQARDLEAAGAALLNFTNSGPVVGPAVAAAVRIPVLGGHGGGPWLDGRIRLGTAALGYAASAVDNPPDTYANVAQVALAAFENLIADVREGRQIKGASRS
jgi:3-methyl-2-oxobutanoate hydroxymethyltransferase